MGLFYVTADSLGVLLFNPKQQAWSLILSRAFLQLELEALF